MHDNIFLNQLVGDLYRRANRVKPALDLPIQVIDSPEIANHIFNAPEIFNKNYSFLEKLSDGRFSANGHDWVARAKLTQPFYHQSTHRISDEQIYGVYANNLHRLENQEIANFWEYAIESAIGVISLSYGLAAPIPWPIEQVKMILDSLAYEQTEAWLNPIDVSGIENVKMITARQAIFDLWSKNQELSQFLAGLSSAANTQDPLFAQGELMQNLLAATETTASGFSWMMYCLGRHQDYQADLTSGLNDESAGQFAEEVLRLFPPVPFVTRQLSQDHVIEDFRFKKNEHILISIVGLHCHMDYWNQPLKFEFPRAELLNKTFNPMAYRPFLSGPRVCGGMRLAKRELILGLKAVLHQFQLSPIETPPAVSYSLTSRPAIEIDQYLKRI